ncbi:MAG: tRNA pseudouridine(55) synthase TruB [Paludisphaera borealis]|uniref:tRNA pseudouridine(55) synthase TruB n=1 Tax=Paludisphaera borealis TaxID=1387353 RepID=UPI00283C69E9|nr:tRNA pseudouridine(55) synthase TruB [Paludisphaera borealis]MDR3622736.1 tRNA pseudouridine(55) synthase TruB [Paludisphaera borealis]
MKTESIGILNLDKPPGRTSRDIVNQVGRLLPRKAKAGHAGTLDPLATGVLVVCVGSATRLIENIQRMGKTYRTVIRLGARSDTHDCDGTIVKTLDPQPPAISEIEAALATQRGEILQQPPEYSALKIDGRRAYDLARAGLPVELAPRPVRIDRVELLSYEWPNLELEIDCGGGTYIRSIARDIGEILGCGALMDALVRTRIGPFTQATAVAPDDLDRETLDDHLRSPLEAVLDLPRITLDALLVADVALGRKITADRLADATIPPGEIALLSSDGDLVALGEGAPDGLAVQPRKVFIDKSS